jgi:hypothetical protein
MGSWIMWRGAQGLVEASDLDKGGLRVKWSQVWDDAADQGFYVRSERTGKRLLFTLSNEERDADHDVVTWTFRSSCGRFTIIVAND